MISKKVSFAPTILYGKEQKLSEKEQELSKKEQELSKKEQELSVELSRVIDNTIKQRYQKEITTSYLNDLKSRLNNLFIRLKDILPENANLPSVIYFIIFVIKKYHTGFNGLLRWKSNSFKKSSISLKKRSILLYCLDYLFGINEDKKVILNQMFYYTNDQLCNRNKRISIEKWDTPKTCSAADMILLILSKDKNLCSRIIGCGEYVANYRDNISQKVRTLRSDITMGGLLDLSKENDNRDSRVFGFMTDIFDNDENNIGNTDEDNVVEKTVETIDETNDGETIDETNVVKNTAVENTAVENTAVENTAVENTAVENTAVETNDGETNDDETNDEKITPGNTRVELTVEINDKNHLMNSQILTTCFILASVLIPIIFK